MRLTSLGIRQVNKEIVEAGQSFGCTSWQLLLQGAASQRDAVDHGRVNQTIMMALSMVIIASMVGAGGLGNDVLASIQRLDIRLGFESGMAVVLLAIILDRITGVSAPARPGSCQPVRLVQRPGTAAAPGEAFLRNANKRVPGELLMKNMKKMAGVGLLACALMQGAWAVSRKLQAGTFRGNRLGGTSPPPPAWPWC